MPEKFFLKITSAVVIDGEIQKAKAIVPADERLAKDLLGRGKAVLATAEEVEQAQEVAEPAEVTEPAAPGAEAQEQAAEAGDQDQSPAQEVAEPKPAAKGRGKAAK